MDLGTNTFHLLIAEGTINDFREIAHEHIGVKLGEGGINKDIIVPEAFERGISTMKAFRTQIDNCNVQQVRAIATSALRNASNALAFVRRVKEEAGIDIEIIDGNREAAYSFNGVKAAGALSAESSLILDIGGGSVEFIIGNKEGILWKQSFEIGAARLMEMFHHTDPIPPASIEALYLYLEDTLGALFLAIKEMPVYTLIGSSGAFETFAELAALKRNDIFDLKNTKNYSFDLQELLTVTHELILSSHAEREANRAIIPVRVDMIVVASLITRYIIQKLAITNIALCTYSLKEGVLAAMMS